MASAAAASETIRRRVQEASGRVRRVKTLDRLATGVVTFGGLFIIVAVSFILVFILGETLPLFRAAQGRALGVVQLAPAPEVGKPLVVGIDEYQLYLYELLPDARLAVFKLADGSRAREFPLPGLAGATIVSACRSLTGDYLGAGTADGRVALQQVRFRPRYAEQKLVDLEIELRDRGLVEIDPGRRPVREVSYAEHEGRKAVAALVSDDEIALYRTSEEGTEQRDILKTEGGERITQLRLGRTDALVAATDRGNLYHWQLAPEVALTDIVHASTQTITAVEYAIGGVSVIVGDARGELSAWFRVRLKDEDEHLTLVQAHAFPGQGTAIRAIGRSSRDKSFVSAGADGSLVLRHLTSERSVLSFPPTGQALDLVLITPKSDGILAEQADGRVARYEISSPHPEVSWRSLFGKTWYEGYAKPEYVWQSTGATDDFEPKFSLVPVLLMTVFLPAFGTAGILLWGRLPRTFSGRLKPGMEVALILPLLVLGGVVAMKIGPPVESLLFGGDLKLWLKSALDLVYDQRNCVVVGIAMGFAVIPIIFTISEDAFSSVPSHLTAASLALGASRWQTATRVVLPTASPGIFSAVMIGFGRAVGETMIVLMATGNTPVLDWSIFDGMRTLSANIAVEIPEAPHGGTLYRVLFLAAGVLFLMTFLVNTIAEVIRQSLRERYRAI